MDIYNKDISDTLLESMQILIDASISKVNYDKTLLYKVIDDSKKSEGLYTVTDGEIEFEAISNDEKYKIDDQVYVTITQGDFSNDKIIVGKKNQTEEEIVNFTPEVDKIVQVEKYRTSDYNGNQIIRVNPGQEKRIAWIPWRDRDIDNSFNRILLSLDYQTMTENYNLVNGSFGMHFHFVSCMDNLIRNYGNNEINFVLPPNKEQQQIQDHIDEIQIQIENLGNDYEQTVEILYDGGFLDSNIERLPIIYETLQINDPKKEQYYVDHLLILLENEIINETEYVNFLDFLDEEYNVIWFELDEQQTELYEQLEKLENRYINDPDKCKNTNEFLEYLYNFNHIDSNKDKQLIISDPYVTFDSLQMIGNIYNADEHTISQNSFRVKDENKKNIVGCFVTFYVNKDFKYQDYTGQIIEATEEQMQNFEFKIMDSSITFGYDQEDFTEDTLILSSYDTIDFVPSDIQLNKNAKSIGAKWIHYDPEEEKYICLIEKTESQNDILTYRFIKSVDPEGYYFNTPEEDKLYEINWYEESIGEPGDEWSGYYWKLLRSTKIYDSSKEANEYIDALAAIETEPDEIYRKAYGNIMNSPYEISKTEFKDIPESSDPQDIITGALGNISNLLSKLIGSSRFLYSYLDIIYMPITSSKTTSVKAVMVQKYALLDEDGNQKTDEEGNVIYSKKRIANSNIINFLNEKYIEKQKYNELVLNILDDQKEFFLYEENCQIENPKLSEKLRTLYVELPTGNEINNLKVTWKIPLTNSMIELPISNDHLKNYTDGRGGYYNVTGRIEKQYVTPESFAYYPGFNGLSSTDYLPNIYYSGNTLYIVYEYDKNINSSSYLEQITKQSFRIKDYFNISATNNNIGCEVSINNDAILGWATKTLLFGQKSSNGSEYNFSIYFTENSNKFFDYDEDSQRYLPVTIQPQLYSTSLELNESAIKDLLNQVEYASLPNNEKLKFESDSIIAQKRGAKDLTRIITYSNPTNQPYGDYIQASVEVNGITLTAYLAIPVRLKNGYTGIQAPVHFNYSSQGERITYLKEPLRLYGENATTEIEGTNYFWSELMDNGEFVLTDENIKSSYKEHDLTITKVEDPRGWYKINVGYSLPGTGNFSSLSLSKNTKYTIGNTVSLYKHSTYQFSKIYNTATITIQEISGNTVYFTSSDLQTSNATQNWYIVPLGNTTLGAKIRHCNSFDSETKQPWQNYDSNDWYSFSYIPQNKSLIFSNNRSSSNPKVLNLNYLTAINSAYQIENETSLQGDYYLYDSFNLPVTNNNAFTNMEADNYRLKNQYFTVALVNYNGKPHIKFRDSSAINFGGSGASFNNLIANIKNQILDNEKKRIDALPNLSNTIKAEYKSQVDQTSFPARFYLITKKNQKVNFLPFSYIENTGLVDNIYFPLQYEGLRDLYYDENKYLYYIYIPGYNLVRETYSITGNTISDVKWRVRTMTARGNAGITSSSIPEDQDIIKDNVTIGSPQIVTGNNNEAQYLQPSPMFIKEDNYFALEACLGNSGNYTTVWLQPLIIRQNLYQNEILNKWNGQTVVNVQDNYILSQVIGAGSKDNENKFSGVFMGKVGKSIDDTSATHGLYGFHQGAQSFGFREDGTAFIGKAGTGRINFNGTKGTITSKSYLIKETGVNPQPQRGAYLDLDEGYLGIKTIDKSYYNGTDPGQGIIIAHRGPRNTDGSLPEKTTLLNIGPSHQFIQSANYSTNTGMKIDLSDGKITGHNANLSFKNGSNTVTISSDVGSNGYPISVNNKFRVDWEGNLKATDASLTGNLSSGTVGGWKINNSGIYKHTKVVWGDDTIDTSEVYSDEFINYITGDSTNCYTKIYAPNKGAEMGINGLIPDKTVIFSSGYEYTGKKVESSSLEDLTNCWTTYQNTKKIPAQPTSLWWLKDSYYKEIMKTDEGGFTIILLTLGAITLAVGNSEKFVRIYNNGNFNFGGGTDTLKFRADTKVTDDTRWPLYINSTSSTCFFGVAFGRDKTGSKYNYGIRFQSLGTKNYVMINHHGIKFVKDGKTKYYDPWKE